MIDSMEEQYKKCPTNLSAHCNQYTYVQPYTPVVTMIFLYSILQFIFLPLLFLPIVAICLLIPKYRGRALPRLGFGLTRGRYKKRKRRVWIHALSVGEVTSALPLVAGIKRDMPELEIIFSAATRAGATLAEKLFRNQVTFFIPFPFDILPVTRRFITILQPDLFILVETDFWPGMLAALRQKKVPALLVNGRISKKSMASYQRFSFLFRPLFASFSILSMQSSKDKEKLVGLGVQEQRIVSLGNLKYDTALFADDTRNQALSFSLPRYKHLLLAGSTHEGEEEIILKSLVEIKKQYPDTYLILAPRNIERGAAIQRLATTLNLQANCRSQINAGGRDLLILDTIGELNRAYSHAHIAFVGGSMVAQGGHNPIEPAIFSVPVLFGLHMEDFSEVSYQLQDAGGAITIQGQDNLTPILTNLLQDEPHRQKMGSAAHEFIKGQQGVVSRHIKLIKEML